MGDCQRLRDQLESLRTLRDGGLGGLDAVLEQAETKLREAEAAAAPAAGQPAAAPAAAAAEPAASSAAPAAPPAVAAACPGSRPGKKKDGALKRPRATGAAPAPAAPNLAAAEQQQQQQLAEARRRAEQEAVNRQRARMLAVQYEVQRQAQTVEPRKWERDEIIAQLAASRGSSGAAVHPAVEAAHQEMVRKEKQRRKEVRAEQKRLAELAEQERKEKERLERERVEKEKEERRKQLAERRLRREEAQRKAAEARRAEEAAQGLPDRAERLEAERQAALQRQLELDAAARAAAAAPTPVRSAEEADAEAVDEICLGTGLRAEHAARLLAEAEGDAARALADFLQRMDSFPSEAFAPEVNAAPPPSAEATTESVVPSAAPEGAFGCTVDTDVARVRALFNQAASAGEWTHRHADCCGRPCRVADEDAAGELVKLRFEDGFLAWFPREALARGGAGGADGGGATRKAPKYTLSIAKPHGGHLGIRLSGTRVEHVDAGSPAEAAGMRRGHCILSVQGIPVATESEVRDALEVAPEGRDVAVAVVDRDGAVPAAPAPAPSGPAVAAQTWPGSVPRFRVLGDAAVLRHLWKQTPSLGKWDKETAALAGRECYVEEDHGTETVKVRFDDGSFAWLPRAAVPDLPQGLGRVPPVPPGAGRGGVGAAPVASGGAGLRVPILPGVAARGQTPQAAAPAARGGANACRDYARGACSRGSSCRYSHSGPGGGTGEVAGSAAPDSQRPCYDYKKGVCSRGPNCRFSHEGAGGCKEPPGGFRAPLPAPGTVTWCGIVMGKRKRDSDSDCEA
eukprot:TRINITY_DN6643_c1_g1_i1.p1 TRINITY_DN6643_c1_g1~~TRINITY_DN6643_c1_g1_i1.p1  ORF type:complete len:798 (+),score=206.18 TRINITY_DN6643_c1_g1_i1:83-2476(+)